MPLMGKSLFLYAVEVPKVFMLHFGTHGTFWMREVQVVPVQAEHKYCLRILDYKWGGGRHYW